MGFEGILNQIFQPYFYYSVMFLAVSLVCVETLTKYCNFISQRTKSLLYLVPLALPLIVMLTFIPSTVIQTKIVSTVSASVAAGSFPFGRFFPLPPQSAYIPTVSTSTVLSVTGIICIIGLVAGALFALSMVLADDRVARKVLHVILLSPNEYQWLQARIEESSKKLAIAAPKIGVVEDLRPNAFTIGYGRNATIVFSMGLFNILSKEELFAVASHELAHVKNNDFFFKAISNALTTVSFFNPLSYVASSTAQREREMFADERAIELLEKPAALGDALAKICRAIQTLPKESALANFSSNLLVASSVLHRVGILSTHPRLDTRLRNISAARPSSRHWGRRNTQLAFLLSLLLIASAVAVSLAMVDLQVNFTASFVASQSLKALPADLKLTSYNVGSGNIAWFSGPVMVPFNGTQSMHELINQPYLVTSGRNIYVEMGNNSAFNSPGNPVVVLIVMTPQNSTYFYIQPPISAPRTLWVG
jgi:Zn-dependent protease with chaperone function